MEKIWIDAVDFDNYGGFALETQFVREMGQPYLMADGVGLPVEPASVEFCVKECGKYRFYIRTKNWSVEHRPDGLVLEVDGKKYEHISSQANVLGWYFEVGADFELEAGNHTLKVYDTTGWFGRFSCVIITNDYDFTPSKEVSVLRKQRITIKGLSPAVTDKGNYDLIVVGGGVGGIVAAITASRYGLKTALINDRHILGGNGSEEGNIALEGSAHRGYHETGVVYEIKNYRQYNRVTWSKAFDYFTKKEKNLDVYSNMLVVDAIVYNDTIKEVLAVNTHDLTEYKFSGSQFVDATGDGWLGYYAGAAYRIGREAKFQHNEEFAPEAADCNTMSGCATKTVTELFDTICSYFAEETDGPVDYIAPDWAFKLPQGDDLGRTPKNLDRGAWWLELPNDYDDVFESEYVRDSMFKMTAGYFDWLKNSWLEKEKARNWRLKAFGTYLAKRETRRLVGDYILTENDFTENTHFFDAVCYCGWNIDVHHINGIFSGRNGRFTLNQATPISPIPFGALYSKNIKNLMIASRCLSVTHIGLGPTRVMLTIGTMGQAVATAAYLCKKYNTGPRNIRNEHIDELQQLLLKDGMSIPGVFNHDKNDLARTALITADSCLESGAAENVVNGRTRKTDGEPYAWISKESAPQSITLTFDSEKTIKQVRVTLDMPFDKYTFGFKEMPETSTLVTDFSVSALTKDGWKTVKNISENIQRLVVIDFEPTLAKAVKITATKTFNCENIIIPEIRIY